MKTRWVLVCLLAALIMPTPAQADPIEDALWDLQNCSPFANVPTVSKRIITGTGGVEDCRFHFGFTICLDYNGVAQPLSCRDYDPGTFSGSTNPIRCTPGVWATNVQIKGVHSDYLERHSGFVIYIDECRLNAILGDP